MVRASSWNKVEVVRSEPMVNLVKVHILGWDSEEIPSETRKMVGSQDYIFEWGSTGFRERTCSQRVVRGRHDQVLNLHIL